MQYEKVNTKYTKINTTESRHGEMGPVWQNHIPTTLRTAHLSVLITVHNFSIYTTQNSSDNLPSYLQTTIIAQILSIGGEGPYNSVQFSVCKSQGNTALTEDCIHICLSNSGFHA